MAIRCVKDFNIFFETLDRPELKIKFEKINIKLKNKIKKIKTNILIIGGAGFIGHNLAIELKKNNGNLRSILE